MPEPKRQPLPMVCRGVNLAAPIDTLAPGDFPYLENTRVLQVGCIEARPGQKFINSVAFGGPVHSVRRLNNLIPGAAVPFTLLTGSGDSLYIGQTAFVPIASGFSGNPLSLIPFRPDQSPESWMYVADSNKMVKVNTAGTVHNVGIKPPSLEPFAEINSSNYAIIDETTSAAGWVNTGAAGTVTQAASSPAMSVSGVIYDNNISGYGIITPAGSTDFAAMQPGRRVSINGEFVTLLEVHPPNLTPNTVAAIQYYSGNTGRCVVTLSTAVVGVDRNSWLLLGGTVNVRVLSVTQALDGTYSLECDTGGSGVVAGSSAVFLESWRVFTTIAHSPGEPITTTQISTTVTQSTPGLQAAGLITKTITLDLSHYPNGRPVMPDDYVHISINTDLPANMLFGQVMFDVDATTNDFTRNYYMKQFRPSDFQSIASGSQSAVLTAQGAVQTNITETSQVPFASGDIFTAADFGPSTNIGDSSSSPQSVQVSAGSNNWSELLFKVSELQRIGTDINQALDDVKKIGLSFNVIGTTIFAISSIWISGGYGPNVVPGSPTGLLYRYRYRSTSTGAKSIPGPATRYQLYPLSQLMIVQCAVSPDPQVDVADIERLDPNLQAENEPPRWAYCGTVPNDGTVFSDNVSPVFLADNPPLETNVIQPWPVLKLPLNGTVNASGTLLKRTGGDPFPTNLLAGALIVINNATYQVYASPRDPDTMEIDRSIGFGNGLNYKIASPTVYGVPLPYTFGPLSGPTASFQFAIGDPDNPGTVYFTNGNDFDSASDKNYVEVTPPNEPLISGAVWNTNVFVASRDRVFMGQPTFNQPNLFTFTQVSSGSGCASRWGMYAGLDGVYMIGHDGIYRISPYFGGQLVSKDLYPLFPHDGAPGVPTNGYNPPDLVTPVNMRMSIADSDVYFDYVDSVDATKQTWRSAPTKTSSNWQPSDVSGWFHHTYAHPVLFHYWEEVPEGVTPRLIQCTQDGFLMSASGTLDGLVDIECLVQLPSLTSGDTRAQKLYVDAMTDFSGVLDVTLQYNYQEITAALQSISQPIRGQQSLNIDAGPDGLALYLNISALLAFNSGTKIFEFQPSFYPQPYLATSLVTQFTDHGMPGWKHQRYARIEIMGGGTVTLKITSQDSGTFIYTFIPSTTRLTSMDFNISALLKGRMFEYSLTGTQPFAFFGGFVRMKHWAGKEFNEVPVFGVANAA